jgi:hypothetical protein
MQPNAIRSEPGAVQLSYIRDIDGRTRVAKRYKEICRALARDQGGPERMSEARAQLIRRFAATSVLAEQLEAKLASGEVICVQEHALLCSSLVRLAQRIGISRVPRSVVPTLHDYLDDANQSEEDAA